MCLIPSTFVLWGQHRQDDVEPGEPRYIHMMISYDNFSWAVDIEIIGNDDVVIVENLENEENVVYDKSVEDGAMIEVDSLELDDGSINLEGGQLKCISLEN
jgi:hypothetical protein